jgi:hypothetical protein
MPSLSIITVRLGTAKTRGHKLGFVWKKERKLAKLSTKTLAYYFTSDLFYGAGFKISSQSTRNRQKYIK